MAEEYTLSQRHKLLRSTTVVSGMTMLSRVLGFARDIILAQIFGAGGAFDAFVIAFKIPNFLRRLFGEGAFAQAFVPILSEFRAQESEQRTQEFINRIAGTLGLVVLLIVIVVELVAPLVVLIFAPGFTQDPSRYDLAVHMIRIIFPYLLFITGVSLAGSILNTFSYFAPPAFTPVLLNLALILVAWFAAPHASVPIVVLAWGVLLGGVIQLSFQLPFLRRIRLLPHLKLGFKDRNVRRVMKLMVPAVFGVSVAQISLLIDNCFASFLPAGSISWLYFSDRLTYLPLGVIGVAIATVVLPNLSRAHSDASQQNFSATLDWALRVVIVMGLPAALGLLTLSGPLLSTLIQHGKFSPFDVIMTRQSLIAYAIGLPGFMLLKVLASGFYSQQNIRTPVRVAVFAMLLNLVLNFILIIPLAHAGLALATSLSALFNAVCLLILLIKRGAFCPRAGWPLFLFKVAVASTVMVTFIVWSAAPYPLWSNWPIMERVLHLFLIIGIAMLLYFAVLGLLGMRIKNFKCSNEDHPWTP